MSFNDLYSLDVETFEWTCLRQNTGNGQNPNQPITPQPEPRGGHVASILGTQDKLFIYGGWSYTSQFSNLWVYDIEKNEWNDPEISHE